MTRLSIIADGNEAVADVAYRLNEVIAIYPITPSSPMGEWADQWQQTGRKNIWGAIPTVVEMQSEGGAAGALHGALQAGALGTTFTASQGLLLMIPNMYKIAGELTPAVIHVTARTLATHALSIFGDHSDVMAARATGFAMLCSNSVQEASDMALIAQAATLESRIPFLHFFDGFRTSHEVNKIIPISDDDLRALIDETLVRQHRQRALVSRPSGPPRHRAESRRLLPGARSEQPFLSGVPDHRAGRHESLCRSSGRSYHLFDYVGAPDAERVIVMMGSGAEAVEETIEHLQRQGEKVGLLKVRLFRPFAADAFLSALPSTVTCIAVLDRYQGTRQHRRAPLSGRRNGPPTSRASLSRPMPRIIGGRYGLSSKEFTPAMVKGIFDELTKVYPEESLHHRHRR